MSIRGRAWQTFLGLMTIVGILGCACPDGFQVMGFDFWNADKYQAELLAEKARAEQLATKSHEAVNRLILRAEITQDIIADRITLAEAAEEFMVMNQSSEDLAEMVRFNFPAPTVEASTVLQVFAFVRVQLEHYSAGEREQIMTRLTCEQQAMESAAPVPEQ